MTAREFGSNGPEPSQCQTSTPQITPAHKIYMHIFKVHSGTRNWLLRCLYFILYMARSGADGNAPSAIEVGCDAEDCRANVRTWIWSRQVLQNPQCTNWHWYFGTNGEICPTISLLSALWMSRIYWTSTSCFLLQHDYRFGAQRHAFGELCWCIER